MLGSPVAHSLSPVLHGAAYEALGLTGWTYERVQCDAAALPGLVGGLDATWVGLSVTMPGKKAALALATSASTRARRLGVANTLVRAGDGWVADCTDVDGVAGALRVAGVQAPASTTAGASITAGPSITAGASGAVLLGAGGTASAAVGALDDLGTESVTVVVRDPGRAADTRAVARAYGMSERTVRFDELGDDDLGRATALVSTTPAGAVDEALAERLVGALPLGAVVLDAVYHPWPTPLAAAATRRGLAVATGLDMLLHQAFGQVEQFTGRPAPRAVMHEALVRATGFEVRPP